MPANILADMNSLGAGLEDQRALQIALELTKLGLNENDSSPPPSTTTTGQAAFESEASMMRKSANMTECVPVPSSEHVAEIVGRQGCKIKALRAKTNTYIKTPVRGEEPVFVVTGRKEDVCAAKREILSAAEHFSQIRASRRNNNTGTPGVGGPGQPNPSLPGQVTIQVRVPYRVVGLVVGPKGATIKRIQQQTHTYIVTPNRDKEPIFEVTGLPENVEKARQEIEGHIAMRTGGMVDTNLNNHLNNMHNTMGGSNLNLGTSKPGLGLDECRTDFHSNGIDAGFHEISTNLLFSSIYNNKSPNITSAFTPYNKALNNHSNNLLTTSSNSGPGLDHSEPTQVFGFSTHMDSVKYNESHALNEAGLTNGSVGLYDSDEGIGGSPTFDSTPLPINSASIWSDLSSESQGSDFSTLFSSISSSGSGLSHVGNLGVSSVAPCLSLPQLCLSGPPTSTEAPTHTRTDTGLSTGLDHSVRRISSDPLSLALFHNSASVTSTSAPLSGDSTVTSSSLSGASSATSSLHGGSPTSTSPTEPLPGPLAPAPRGRHCMVCTDGDIVAALVPCGHNLFCMDCANKLVHDSDKHCPICQQPPTQAIRIFT